MHCTNLGLYIIWFALCDWMIAWIATDVWCQLFWFDGGPYRTISRVETRIQTINFGKSVECEACFSCTHAYICERARAHTRTITHTRRNTCQHTRMETRTHIHTHLWTQTPHSWGRTCLSSAGSLPGSELDACKLSLCTQVVYRGYLADCPVHNSRRMRASCRGPVLTDAITMCTALIGNRRYEGEVQAHRAGQRLHNNQGKLRREADFLRASHKYDLWFLRWRVCMLENYN